MLRKGAGLETAERNKLGQELKKVIVDQQWVIGTVGFIPVMRVIGRKPSTANQSGRAVPRSGVSRDTARLMMPRLEALARMLTKRRC